MLIVDCCCSVSQLHPTVCNAMNCSTPGFPVFHHLLELAQTHLHWVGDAIQPSHPLSSPFPPALNLSQHLGKSQLFTSGGQSIGASTSASVLPMNIQDWFPLGLTIWSPCSPRDSQESSPTPQFKNINSLMLSLLQIVDGTQQSQVLLFGTFWNIFKYFWSVVS